MGEREGGDGYGGRRDVREVGRRRTGEENLPKVGGLNKRNGSTIDG